MSGLLNVPLAAAGRRGSQGTVWHCVLSAAPPDLLLSDDEWNRIAIEFMDRMGLAHKDDPCGVRWVAVRHGLSKGGIDHVHLVATLARQDGQLPSVHNDYYRARTACRAIERQFGLTVTAPADHTASARPTRAETELSVRTSRSEPPRITLRRKVQEAAAVAASEPDFFARLRDATVLIREQHAGDTPGRITGYAVGLPGHCARDGGQVWFSGGKLAPDLTLPRLRRRWERPGDAEQHHGENLSPRSARAFLRAAAYRAADHAGDHTEYFRVLEAQAIRVRVRYSGQNPAEVTGYAVSLDGHTDTDDAPSWYSGGQLAADLTLPQLRSRWNGGPAQCGPRLGEAERQAIWTDIIRLTSDSARQFQDLARNGQPGAADVAVATADTLRTTARVIKGASGAELRRAAADFDRAAREAYGTVPLPTIPGDRLRTASRLLAITAGNRSAPAAMIAALTAILADLADATAELHRVRDRPHQASAAHAAVARLRRAATMKRHDTPYLPELNAALHVGNRAAASSATVNGYMRARPPGSAFSSRPRRSRGPAP